VAPLPPKYKLREWYSEWAHANAELARKLESGNANQGNRPAAPHTQAIAAPIPGIMQFQSSRRQAEEAILLGKAQPVPDPRLEWATLYKASGLKVASRGPTAQARPADPDGESTTALDAAKRLGYNAMVRLLVERGAQAKEKETP